MQDPRVPLVVELPAETVPVEAGVAGTAGTAGAVGMVGTTVGTLGIAVALSVRVEPAGMFGFANGFGTPAGILNGFENGTGGPLLTVGGFVFWSQGGRAKAGL